LRGGREGGQMDALLAARDLRQVPPDFLASKTHDRRKQSHQRFSDVPDRGLSAATAVRLRRRNVEAILEHIEVKRAQIHDAEMVHPVIDLVESKLVVTVTHIVRK